ncbi:MAG: heme-copper oxidase subunit III [Bacteroidia bacterium]
MNLTSQQLKQEESNYIINPKKFVLWLFIVASLMLFAGFTSAYIVRRGDGNWEFFNLPNAFAINIIIALISSVFMQTAYYMAKKDNIKMLKNFLLLTLGSAIAFLIIQLIGWQELTSNNVYFAFSNPSNSFVYVISGVHFVHVIGGLVFILATTIQAFRFKVHKTNLLLINMCTTFWHFLAAMWIYLYVFMYIYR